MKKIPTLFERIYKDHNVIEITEKVTPGMGWVLNGEGLATLKFDGSCCAIIDGILYKRYDCKKGKVPPEGAISCCDPDPVTGHWPHWVFVDHEKPEDKWFAEAYNNTQVGTLTNGTFEAIGPHFQGNPYLLPRDVLVRHGSLPIVEIGTTRTFAGIRDYLKNNEVEGIVFWKDNTTQCKIKRSDFGFTWPVKNK